MAFFTKRYHPPGTPAGTLSGRPPELHYPLRIHVADYTSDKITVREDVSIEECRAYRATPSMTWIHVAGQPTEPLLHELAEEFGLHRLALEDVLNSGQRPKAEQFDDQLFVVMSLPLMESAVVDVQQVSLFLAPGMLLSFHDGDFALFRPILRRLEEKSSRLRSRGGDFLFYSMLDLIIDQGFPVLENFGAQLEQLEEEILQVNDRTTLEKLHIIKRELTLLRRMLWPQREVINQLLRDESPLVGGGTRLYLRDCYDHTIQVMDLIETYREMTTGMLDIYLSSVSNRTNEIMRLLTVIATIFIPLTFITGIYGMNFDRAASHWNMPELGWPYGYPLLLGVMIGIVGLMLAWFKRQGWL